MKWLCVSGGDVGGPGSITYINLECVARIEEQNEYPFFNFWVVGHTDPLSARVADPERLLSYLEEESSKPLGDRRRSY